MTTIAPSRRDTRRLRATTPVTLAGHTVAQFLLNAGTIAVAGWILWSTAGTSVIDGTVSGQLGFLAVLITGVAAQALLTQRLHAASRIGLPAFLITAAAAQAAIPVALLAATSLTDNYYLAWLATLATFTLLVASIFRLLTAAVAPSSGSGTAHHTRHPITQGATALFTLAVAVAALIATANVHEWSAPLINGLLLLTGVGTLCGYLTSLILARTWHR